MTIFELLGMSLGVERSHYRKFFEDGCSVMRGNNYPPCKAAELTLGTGPHSDPSSLTILHQDEVGGLEIFCDNKWRAIKPYNDAFVVNIGDTFMVRIYATNLDDVHEYTRACIYCPIWAVFWESQTYHI